MDRKDARITLQRSAQIVDDQYISSFVRDANRFFDRELKNYEGLNYESSTSRYGQQLRNSGWNDLSMRAGNIRDYLQNNRGSLQWNEDLQSLLDFTTDFDRQARGIHNAFEAQYQYYDQFENEKEYVQYMDYLKDLEEKRSLDVDAYSQETQTIEKALDEYKSLSKWEQDEAGNARLEAIRQKYGGLNEMESLISDRRKYLTLAKRVQEQDAEREKYSQVVNNPDFSEYSGFDASRKDIGYQYVNADLNERLALEQKYGQYAQTFGDSAFDSLTDEEKQIYNYYMNTGDKESAAAYLKYLQETLNYRKGQHIYESGYQDQLLMEYIFGAEAGLDQFRSGVQGLGNLIAGRDEYVAPSAKQYASQMMREDLADEGWKLPSWLGGASLGQIGYDAITTTANMVPSIATSTALGILNPAVGAAAGGAMLGGSAAGNAYQEALNEGYSVDQARAYGILSGASEIVMEKVLGGISAYGGNALGKVFTQNMRNADTALRQIAKNLGGSMLSEFSEEYLQEVLTPVFQNLTLGTDNEVKLLSSEALYAGLLGAITGGILEGPQAIAEARNATETPSNAIEPFDNATEPFDNTTPALEKSTPGGVTEESSAADDKMSATESVVTNYSGKNESSSVKVGVSKMETVQQAADIESFAQQFGTQADAVRRNYMEGQDLQEYELGFEAAYTMGRDGGKAEALSKHVPYLSQSQREIAFSLGRDAAAAQKATEPKKATVAAKMTTEEGTQDVAIAEVVDMNETTMTFRLEDGRTVTDDDLSFDKGQQVLASVWGLGMDVKSANTILTESVANTVDEAAQAAGIEEAYRYGSHGYSMKQLVERGIDAGALTDGQRQAAWKAGRISRQQAAAAAPQAEATATGKGGAGIYFDAGSGNVTAFSEETMKGLTGKRKAGVQAAVVLQKLGIGQSYHFFESYVNEAGDRVYKDANGVERTAPNGWYDRNDGSIHIDLNAGSGGDGLTLYTLSHELTHFVEQWSKPKYQALADFLVESYGKGASVDTLVMAKQKDLSESRGAEVSYEEAYSEFIADSMEAMLADGNVLEKLTELKTKDKSLFDKMQEFFRNLARKIREIYKGLTPDSAEGKAVLEMKDQIEQIQQLFAEALADAGENFQAADGHKNTAHEERQFSDRYPSSQITEQDRKYLDAVNRGDMAMAQKMVDDAAKADGYDSPKLYHGTNAFGFTEFIPSMSDDRISIFATSNRQVAETYSGETSRRRISDKAKITPEELENASPEKLLKLLRENISKDYRLVSEAERDQIIEANRAPLLQAARSVENLYVINMDMFDGKKKDALFAVSEALRDMAKADEYSVFMDKKMSYDDALWDLRWLDDSLTDEVISAIGRNENMAFRELTKWLGATMFHADAEYSRINGTPWMNSTEAVNELFPRLFKGVYELYGRTGNAFEMEAGGANWNQLDGSKIGQYGPVKTRDVARYAKENGHDSAIFRNIKDNGDYTYSGTSDVYVFFGSDNLKSADPVTYDDDGKIIPPSKRFDPHKKDIRYSDRKKPGEYGGFREVLAKKGLDELSVKLGDRFPLSAKFDEIMRNDGTKLVMEDVAANSVVKGRKESAYKVGRKAFTSKYGVKTRVHIDQMGIDADLYADVANESISKAIGQTNEQSTLDVIPHVGDILSNSILMGVERIAHTDNKGTALYGYRLYNLYWYTDGNKKTPHALVCTVVQDLNKAEGYVFKNIENVTIGRGLPGANAGMSSSVNGDTYTVAQLYEAVKKIDRNDGGLKYFDEERAKYLFSYTERDDGVAYQDRSADTSNRALLAGAFEELVTSPDELRFIRQYQENVALLNEQEEILQELRNQIREISFGKGERDVKKLKQLQEEATKTANRIDIYDRKLLKLERAKPLRDVLDREREKVHKATREKGQEAMEAYREKRKESAARKDARRKIRKTIMELDKLLNRGDKKKNVKDGMSEMVSKSLKLAEALFMDEYSNRDMLRNGVGIQMTDAEEAAFRDAYALLERIENGSALAGKEFGSEIEAHDYLQKLDGQLSGKMAKLKDVFARERKRLYGTTVSDLLGQLADEYNRLSEAEDGAVRAAKDENVYAHLLQLKEDVGGTTVRDMTLGQMEQVADAFTMVLTTVRNANKMFAKNLKFKRDTLAGMVMREIGAAAKKFRKLVSPGKDAADRFSWNNLKPVYAFERLGSETLKTLFGNIRKGQDVWAVDMQEADAFRREQYRKHNRKNWDPEKLHSFEFESEKVELSLEQIMSLYAYSRREQALDHLLKGGFVFGGSTEVIVKKNGIKRRYLKKDATAYNLSSEELLQVIDTLNAEQKAFVEEMQTYLSDVMGGKGNEISLQMYGIKSFGEKNYFPIRSAGQYMEKAKEDSFRKEQGQISIVNSGFTKAVAPKANNPITLDGFMDVWAEHVNDMAMYHGFVLPMEDFRRVYNYSTPNVEEGNSQSVNAAIENAFGKAATAYIDQLYKDLNGGAVSDNRESLSKKLVSLHKKAAVFASASVVIQQPSAIVRAFALIDSKHFIGPKVDHKRHKLLWEEVKKYAPVAFVKEMGYFDTGMGRSAKDYLQAEEYSGIREKAKALFKDGDYRDEILGKAPALADEITWCSIWEAVKRETKSRNPSMDVRSDAFLKIAGDRFSEVIDRTQVYDSVLSRSANMRSKALHMNMLTSFMAEPTTSINMLEDALRSGDKRKIKRTVGAVYGSVLLNSLLVSLVYSARDDDEDKTWWEKYLSSVAVEMLDGINPITYYPLLRDIWSISQGYDVERADMSLISDFVTAAQKVTQAVQKLQEATEENQDTVMEALKDSLWDLVDSIGSLFGLPVKNIRRDYEGVQNLIETISTDLAGRETTDLSLRDSVLSDLMRSIPFGDLFYSKSRHDKLYEALISGDDEYAQRLKDGYDSDSSYESAMRKALREHDPRIKEMADAYYEGDYQRLEDLSYEIEAEGVFEFDTIKAAYEAEKRDQAEERGLTEEEAASDKSESSTVFSMDSYYQAIRNGNSEGAETAYDALLQEKLDEHYLEHEAEDSIASSVTGKVKDEYLDEDITETDAVSVLTEYGGKSEAEAETEIKKWKFEMEYHYAWGSRARCYRSGTISRDQLVEAIMDIQDTSEEDAELQVEVYDWETEGYEGATVSRVRYYNASCAEYQVPKDTYLHIRKFSDNTDNDVDENGKLIKHSAMKKVIAEIDAQKGLSSEQKDAIAKSFGWEEKNIQKYKTW